MNKRKFSHSERYAVWVTHERRCWLCLEPLRLIETTIDHVIPETLLHDEERLVEVLAEYGVPLSFNINGFENWLPCHNHCNQKKGNTVFTFTPANKLILDRLAALAPKAQHTANAVKADASKDKLFGKISVAVEEQAITLEHLQELMEELGAPPLAASAPVNMIRLDNGYWLHEDDIARECRCQCERERCLESTTKVHCIFSRMLSNWVITAGLYWKCYDEMIQCPRCNKTHRRGHVGHAGTCGRPYINQVTQTD
jgi:hypothetical protein